MPQEQGFSAWQCGTEAEWRGGGEEAWKEEAPGDGVSLRLKSGWRLRGTKAGVPCSARCPGRHKSEVTGDIVSVQQVLLK